MSISLFTIHLPSSSSPVLYEWDSTQDAIPTVIELLRRCGVMLSAPCGGCTHCGRCAVWLSGDIYPPDSGEYELLQRLPDKGSPPADGYELRLACSARLRGNCEIIFPDDNIPSVTAASLCDNTSLSALYNSAQKEVSAAFDLGTTTISIRLFQGKDIIYEKTLLNAQRSFGADVISRIAFCDRADGLSQLHDTVRQQLFDMLSEALALTGARLSPADVVPVAANTTMLYLLAGISPTELGRSPYMPSEKFGKSFEICCGGQTLHTYMPPCTGGFTGGDLTCCLVALETYKRDIIPLYVCDLPDEIKQYEHILMCDLGTNGEIALFSGSGSDSTVYVTSAAAGPALEGGNISCGSGAVQGAISRIFVTAERPLSLGHEVIGGCMPKTLSGSALLELTSILLRHGIIDGTGRMECEKYDICEQLSLTQADIRQLQLAKGAVCAAAKRLLELAEIEAPDAVIITGGLGYRVEAETVRDIGLLPLPEDIDRIYFTPALAMEGAMLCCDKVGRNIADSITARCHCIDLTADDRFDTLFIENMEFNLFQ